MSKHETKEAKELLLNELKKEDFFETMDCKKAWIAFKKFAGCEFYCEDDSFLWQTGTYNFTGEFLFNYSIVRQFSHDVDGEYHHMEQLNLTMYFKPDKALDELQESVWSYDFNKENFFQEVENRKSFTLPPSLFAPIKYDVSFERV